VTSPGYPAPAERDVVSNLVPCFLPRVAARSAPEDSLTEGRSLISWSLLTVFASASKPTYGRAAMTALSRSYGRNAVARPGEG
jgi:hypothetical protein